MTEKCCFRFAILSFTLRYIGFYYIATFSHDNGDRTSLRQNLSYSSYLLTETLGYNNKSETSRTWVKNSRFRDRNKCTKNETARLFVKDAEISRLDEKFARPTIFEVPFATPYLGNKDIRGRGIPRLLRVRFFSQIVLADIFSLRNLLLDLFSFG